LLDARPANPQLIAMTGTAETLCVLGTQLQRHGFVVSRLLENLLNASGRSEVSVSKVENIEQEVQNLTPSELAVFRRWFLEFDAQVWDRQIDEDGRGGKLEALAEEALEAHRSSKSKEL
jgi:hypothetical protein